MIRGRDATALQPTPTGAYNSRSSDSPPPPCPTHPSPCPALRCPAAPPSRTPASPTAAPPAPRPRRRPLGTPPPPDAPCQSTPAPAHKWRLRQGQPMETQVCCYRTGTAEVMASSQSCCLPVVLSSSRAVPLRRMGCDTAALCTVCTWRATHLPGPAPSPLGLQARPAP